MSKDEIRLLLERLGHAMSVGDLKRASACWDVPALLLLDEAVVALADASDLENLMAKASASYRSHGVASTRPEIEHIEILSDRLAAVDVRWPALDSSGREQMSERSHYLMQLGNDGHPRIRVALTRTK